ncbi:hypothetical protein FB451DRAFT_965156, partial [Mycena latifolia]
VADLPKEEVIKQITTTSTFYLPPYRLPDADPETLQKLQGLKLELRLRHLEVYPRSRSVLHVEMPSPPACGVFEQAAVDHLEHHTIPREQLCLRGSRALRRFMADLALQPELRQWYKEDPASVVNAIAGMSAEEKFALTLHHPGPIFTLMRGTPEAIANG